MGIFCHATIKIVNKYKIMGVLGACPQLKCKFILSQPSRQNPFLLHLLSNLCTSLKSMIKLHAEIHQIISITYF